MKKIEAEQIILNALVGYIEDCAGKDSPEAKQIEKAWKRRYQSELSLTPKEKKHMKTILDQLDCYGELYDTHMKVMRALGIKI
jgi:hypothetical protein